MLSAIRARPVPLVLLTALYLLSGCPSSSAVPSEGTGTTRPGALRPRGFLVEPTEDYDVYTDGTTIHKTDPTGAPAICDYDPCREPQTPCSQLAASSGCLCPGVSSDNAPPEAPVLKTLQSGAEGSAEVTVRWCAPYSRVNSYVVTVGGKELSFDRERRSGALGDLEHVTQVCVAALNDAGRSEESCAMYRPPGDHSAWLKAGLIGGALGFLLLLSLGLLLWRHRVRRKAEARISTRSTHDAERTE